MSDLKIAIILGSTRPGRNGKAVADWVLEKAQARTAARYELVDLADYQAHAREIGADGYSENASGAVGLVRTLLAEPK